MSSSIYQISSQKHNHTTTKKQFHSKPKKMKAKNLSKPHKKKNGPTGTSTTSKSPPPETTSSAQKMPSSQVHHNKKGRNQENTPDNYKEKCKEGKEKEIWN